VKERNTSKLNRRQMLKGSVGALAAFWFPACGSSSEGGSASEDVTAAGGDDASASGRDDLATQGGADAPRQQADAVQPRLDGGSTDPGASQSDEGGSEDAPAATADAASPITPDSAADSDDSSPVTILAAGGTAAIAGAWPDPFAEGSPGPSCELTCSQTLGPCRADAPVRRDITEERPGLPMRLSLLVVTGESCAPVPDAEVEIWHTDANGVYSGQTPSNICNGNDPDATSRSFMRGVQVSDAGGRVDFDSVYPGWYPGRTPHIHFQVRVGGQEIVTSQLYFDDDFSARVYPTHPDYTHRGAADTTNDRDGVIRSNANAAPFIPETKVTGEGGLLAWITLALRSSTGEPLCTAL